MVNIDLAFVDETVTRVGGTPDLLVRLLQEIQEHYRYLPPEALQRLCAITGFPRATVAGVSTFYPQFRHHPTGRHLIRVCQGTACHVKGSQSVRDALRRYLRIPEGNDSDEEGNFTIEEVGCMGCCTLAPVVRVDDITYGHIGPEIIPDVITDFLTSDMRPARHVFFDRPAQPSDGKAEVRVGLGSCCVAKGSDAVFDRLERALTDLRAEAVVKRVGCVGRCYQTPMVEVALPGKPPAMYVNVQPETVEGIVRHHFRPRGLRKMRDAVSRMIDSILTDETWEEPVRRFPADARDPDIVAFAGRQQHIATENFGEMDPIGLDEYLAHEGYVALTICLENLSPEKIIAEIKESALRGRGGAGFPTATKWNRVRVAAGTTKYVICNGDEGDPGAFMDRMLLESFPYRVIEGMTIAAFAVGASEGYFYIRAEYQLALQRIEEALRQLRMKGLLGDNILNTGFRFDIKVHRGGGAFICGEETALLECMEGRRAAPRHRPPYPSERGLWGKPTLINNVETYAVVPWILRHGGKAFAALGTGTSRGTKVFALAGKVVRGGLIEVPMGITIREIVEDIGGGIAQGHRFKAVQIGGPSGGCVPATLADTRIDYESLHAVGAMMGSGGLVVLDEKDCMVDIARYFLQFNTRECCGECTFGRVGTRRMLDILNRLCEGHGVEEDLEHLECLGTMLQKSSLCGLGRTAPNPVLSTLRYFRDEYAAHVAKRCPAGRCRALITFSVSERCIGCTLCAQHCPVNAIAVTPFVQHTIDADLCIRCSTCRRVCPENAIEVK